MRSTRRHGLTLMDVIVTIVILTILVALLLPQVQRMRSLENGPRCNSNLKQIAIGLHSYHDFHRRLPPGWTVSETTEQSSGFGWGFQILPYVDQVKLHDQFNAEWPLADLASGNAGLARTKLPMYRCPQDQGPDQAASPWIALMGTTNYVGNFGVGIPTSFSSAPDNGRTISDARRIQGIFGANSSVRLREITDGTSNTILAGERRLPVSGNDWPVDSVLGAYNSSWAGVPNLDHVSPLAVVATATGMSPELAGDNQGLNRTGDLNGLLQQDGVQSLPYFGINRGSRGELIQPDDSPNQVSAGFSSAHTGGCHVLLCDGAVKFISNEIDPIVFANLMRRADGVVLGDF